jgi:hypothetical protein
VRTEECAGGTAGKSRGVGTRRRAALNAAGSTVARGDTAGRRGRNSAGWERRCQ